MQRARAEIGADFDLAHFAHRAFFNERAARVEMHLESLVRQTVTVAGEKLTFEQGETIWTESSYKFEPRGIAQMAERAGLGLADQWVDGPAGFALSLFRVG